MVYNLTSFDNLTSPVQVIENANNLTNGLAMALILLVVFVLILIVFKQYDTKDVILVDAFICTILAALFWAAGWIGYHILIWPILILFGAIIAKLFWPE